MKVVIRGKTYDFKGREKLALFCSSDLKKRIEDALESGEYESRSQLICEAIELYLAAREEE